MHFSYVKSNILRRWLNILRNYVHSRTFFTLKIHPPPTTLPAPLPLPATRPGPPPDLPATRLASHPTLPDTPPCQPPHPAHHPILPAAFPDSLAHLVSHDGAASVATR